MTSPTPDELCVLAKWLTPLRRAAFDEIAAAGDTGLGFGRCSMIKRRELLAKGLTRRPPATGPMVVLREVLTPLGHELARSITQADGARG